MNTNQITNLDEMLLKIPNLKWLPWVGENYSNSEIIILGESLYNDGHDWQDRADTVRILIAKRFLGDRGKLYTNVEKVLLSMESPSLDQGLNVWKSVVYCNLVHRLLSSIKERPNDSDLDTGWHIFFNQLEILRPRTCIVLGKSSCGRLGYYLNNVAPEWNRNIPEFYENEKIIHLSKGNYNLTIIFIHHPSGARGFNYGKWADLVRENAPDLRESLLM